MRFAQILHNKAHWIFEAGEQPQFAPNIVIVDITNKPDVQEGWEYNEATGTFSEPAHIVPEPILPSETEILADYIIDVDYRVTMIELGL